MGVTTLLSFIIVVYGKNDGFLGEECNREVSNSCDAVFRARSTVFATLTLQISLYVRMLTCRLATQLIFALSGVGTQSAQPQYVQHPTERVILQGHLEQPHPLLVGCPDNCIGAVVHLHPWLERRGLLPERYHMGVGSRHRYDTGVCRLCRIVEAAGRVETRTQAGT